MDIIKTSFILCFTLLIASCGGDSSDSEEIIFPDHLPVVNPTLSTENQSGIWMVYRVTTEITEERNDDGETVIFKKEIIANELGTIVFHNEEDDNLDHYHHDLDCTSNDFSPDPDLHGTDTHEQGYTELYRDNENEDYGSSGRIAVSYLSSQEIHGQGWKIRQYLVNGIKTGIRQEVEFFAVKVSDEDNFLLSDDLNYSSSINSDDIIFDKNKLYGGMCLGLQEHKFSSKVGDNEAGSYKFQYFQHYVDFDHTFEIYNGKSTNSENYQAGNNQVVGVSQRFNNIDNYCLSSDFECVNKYSFQSEILQNNSSGISFTAKLTGNADLNNEVYIDAQISVIIHPFESAETSQE
ncbi:MAG: hypothetical protein V7765_16205 [Oleispira sp.]